MPLGGLAPLPLRLGPGGITAEQHARLCADLVAVDRVMPCLSMTVAIAVGAGTLTLIRYAGRNGTGPMRAPKFRYAAGALRIELGESVNNMSAPVNLLADTGTTYAAIATDSVAQGAAAEVIDGGATISIPWVYASAATIRVDVYAPSSVQIGDYGGHVAKRNSVTEGTTTYAFSWYRMLKNANGSGYSQIDTSVRSWKLKAYARALGTAQRTSEMLAASSTPHGSDLKLGRWADIMGVQTANLPKWEVRRQCEALYSDRNQVTAAAVDAALASIMGSVFASTSANHGTIAAPPSPSYWPGTLNGDALYDISGAGVYSSPRGLLTINVVQGAYSDDELTDLMTRDVATWLDNALPATDSWQWTRSTTGFLLGTSKLGMDSL